MVLKHSYILDIKNALTFDKALSILNDALQEFGYSHYCFSNMSTNNSPAIFKLNDLWTSYPKEWTQTYEDKPYIFSDPIAIRLMANKEPFYWSQMIAISGKTLSDESKVMMNHAQQYGICDGMGFSYLHNQGNLHTLCVSKGDIIQDYDPIILSQFYLLGALLVEKYEGLKYNQTKKIILSEKEKLIVTWGAVGKTDNEIGQLMDISVNTVRYHWKNIFEKLESYSRVFAIIQAMNLGFIDTQVFEITTESGSSETYHRNV